MAVSTDLYLKEKFWAGSRILLVDIILTSLNIERFSFFLCLVIALIEESELIAQEHQ